MNNKQQISGLPCPVCKGFIPTTMHQIITASRILCPHCGLQLNINRSESMNAINALKKVQDAQDNLNRKSRFGKK